jgi:glycosyltransferase involved in cell wall biosynthesis
VTPVTGYVGERKKAIEQIKREVAAGRQIDFVYSESSTVPTLLAVGNYVRPFLDFGFLKWCREQAIPVGLFYRDFYWRFGGPFSWPWYKRTIANFFYRYDWLKYPQLVDHLFLPSLAVHDMLHGKFPESRVSTLPPGCDVPNSLGPTKGGTGRLELFYVGGITPPLYDLRPAVEAIRNLEGVFLTLCCRKDDWQQGQSYYVPLDPTRVRVVHESGEALEALYQNADLFVPFRRSHPYLDLAMPVKLFEALGHALPIVTTAGTEAARFVTREGIGWAVSSQQEFVDLLRQLKASPHEIQTRRDRMRQVREHHTWPVRAKQVMDTLLALE